jgi:hypothetical protein
MELDLTAEQRRFRDERRSCLSRMTTDALVRELEAGGEGGGPEFRRAMQQMGRDGLFGLSSPRR